MHHHNDSPGRVELFYRTVISMTDEERADALRWLADYEEMKTQPSKPPLDPQRAEHIRRSGLYLVEGDAQ